MRNKRLVFQNIYIFKLSQISKKRHKTAFKNR